MADILKSLPLTFIPLFVAIDIFAVLPVFLAMTHGLSREKNRTIIKESIVTALFVSLAFIAMGEAIFRILGITNNDFKIAGGLVILVFAVLELVRTGEGKRPEGHRRHRVAADDELEAVHVLAPPPADALGELLQLR